MRPLVVTVLGVHYWHVAEGQCVCLSVCLYLGVVANTRGMCCSIRHFIFAAFLCLLSERHKKGFYIGWLSDPAAGRAGEHKRLFWRGLSGAEGGRRTYVLPSETPFREASQSLWCNLVRACAHHARVLIPCAPFRTKPKL